MTKDPERLLEWEVTGGEILIDRVDTYLLQFELDKKEGLRLYGGTLARHVSLFCNTFQLGDSYTFTGPVCIECGT